MCIAIRIPILGSITENCHNNVCIFVAVEHYVHGDGVVVLIKLTCDRVIVPSAVGGFHTCEAIVNGVECTRLGAGHATRLPAILLAIIALFPFECDKSRTESSAIHVIIIAEAAK